ncbi:NAD(P)/FAD-dependent oxidoreductase [Roseospira visakhapatnamensis]|uniref:Sulfide dehydrogenase [flavocytochrome c] flavoprotein subunit n=1 Tax=Roseospira visakhapatnamensis TaxID=390880 RepID=A0A7W6RAR9_9PROT|nr:NAD(P)/FAD-dependent oxidoreductase [Roseospira visakhapatnamensis]MBB4265088.1 sulfide dehydrogenase [flavocytochrome c] flavoprotein subunit [Roseospira visakhapatnamensis]
MTTRRTFLHLAGASAALGLAGFPSIARAAGPRVVIVGGGPAGATAARYLKRYAPDAEVTLVEANPTYTTCFMSNEVLAGDRSFDTLQVGYDAMRAEGITVVHDRVTGVDATARTVTTQGGDTLSFDRCMVAPGIDFKYDAIEGYSAEVADSTMLHAWKAGPQTQALRQQLESMEDGGTFVLVSPPNPFRCPPGPYERVSLVASYFKRHKPRSKIILLDAKDKFSKQGLFTEAWEKLYGFGTDDSMIEWISGSNGGGVTKVDPSTMTVSSAGAGDFKGDVVNIIPPQKAGRLAFDAGLADGDWVTVNKGTFECLDVPGIHVLGDASAAAAMPKSASSANSQAKAAVAGVLALARDQEPPSPKLANACYSIAGPEFGFSVAAVYQFDDFENHLKPIEGAGGVSPANADPSIRAREEVYAHSWFENIKTDVWGV